MFKRHFTPNREKRVTLLHTLTYNNSTSIGPITAPLTVCVDHNVLCMSVKGQLDCAIVLLDNLLLLTLFGSQKNRYYNV